MGYIMKVNFKRLCLTAIAALSLSLSAAAVEMTAQPVPAMEPTVDIIATNLLVEMERETYRVSTYKSLTSSVTVVQAVHLYNVTEPSESGVLFVESNQSGSLLTDMRGQTSTSRFVF